MTKCENCVKCDVCKITDNINENIKSLCLTEPYQRLVNNGVAININCTHYLNKFSSTTKILTSEN